MPHYRVDFSVARYDYVYIFADTEKEAEDIAWDDIRRLGDEVEIKEIEEV